jgi:phage repressor protein C with HTH and peptisase S24 domain
MITHDRIELNKRFVKVFNMLESRGVIQKNDREGRGMGDFAERVLGKRGYSHIIQAFLNPENRRVIDYHHAKRLCEEYGVNERWMLHGEGSPFGVSKRTRTPAPVSTPRNQILFTSIEAFAGATIGADSFVHEDVETFSLPGLEGDGLVCFPIKGNSMEPVIQDGDLVICKAIDSPDRIRENEIYAIHANGSVWVKYIQKITNKRGRVTGLRLVSANYLEHDPFEEEINEYTRIYKVVRRITDVNG